MSIRLSSIFQTALLGLVVAGVAQSEAKAQSSSSFQSFGSRQVANFQASAEGRTTNSIQGITDANISQARGFRPEQALTQSGRGSVTSTSVPTFSSSSPASKPFSNITPSSTVSPYLSMFNTGIIGDEVDNFNALVRPQLRQQQINNQFQRQTQELNRRFQSLSARPAFNPQGSERVMATGHRTTFGNTLQYYPLRGRR